MLNLGSYVDKGGAERWDRASNNQEIEQKRKIVRRKCNKYEAKNTKIPNFWRWGAYRHHEQIYSEKLYTFLEIGKKVQIYYLKNIFTLYTLFFKILIEQRSIEFNNRAPKNDWTFERRFSVYKRRFLSERARLVNADLLPMYAWLLGVWLCVNIFKFLH